jgi:hypothetical protein
MTLCEPWPSSELFAVLPYCGFVRLLLRISEQFNFYDVRPTAPRPSSTWRINVSLFVWLLPLDLFGLGSTTSSYATAGIALRVSGALKPHHHDKVGIASIAWFHYHKVHGDMRGPRNKGETFTNILNIGTGS